VILDLRFPFVIYKKLLGQKPTLEDLVETKPVQNYSFHAFLFFVEKATELSFATYFRAWGPT
jgi:hypothetical protein